LANVACTTISEHFPGVYEVDVQQGNIITQDMVDQLRPRMNKRQVLFIMGSPMLKNPFDEKRWDYVYSDQPGGEPRLQKRITLFFDGEELIAVQGDFKPSNEPVPMVSKDVTVEVPRRQVEKTLWEKLSGLFE